MRSLSVVVLLIVLPNMATGIVPPLGNELAWWRFDAQDVDNPEAGLVWDASDHGNHLRLNGALPNETLLGGHLDTAGHKPSSIPGDGGLDGWGSGSMAVALWVKAVSPPVTTELIIKRSSCGQAWPLAIALTGESYAGSPAGTPVARVGTGEDHLWGTGSITDGKWHHLVYSRDVESVPASARFLVDGAEVASGPVTHVGYQNAAPLTLGGDPGCGGNVLEGSLDDVRVYDRPMGDSEGAILYAAGLPTHT